MDVQWDTIPDKIDAYLPHSPFLQTLVGLVILLVSAFVAQYFLTSWIKLIFKNISWIYKKIQLHQELNKKRVYRYFRLAFFSLVIYFGFGLVPNLNKSVPFIEKVFDILFWVFLTIAASKMLSAFYIVYTSQTKEIGSIKSYIQMAKLFLYIISAIVIVSIIINQSPLLMLSGIGALSAVLMLVFRDTLFSFVATTLITNDDLVRVGDWIQIPQFNADGFVTDISLHAIKIKNWDNTLSTIPTYRLFSDSFKNYRQMFESGARQILKCFYIDVQSIRVIDQKELEWLENTRQFVLEEQDDLVQIPGSNVKLTGGLYRSSLHREQLSNLAVLRAYLLEYFSGHPEVRQDYIFTVYNKDPLSNGAIPLEIFLYTRQSLLVDFSRVQAELLENIFMVMNALGLRLYQMPSSYESREGKLSSYML